MNRSITANESLFLTIEKISETVYNVCSSAPPNIVSDGLWASPNDHRTPMKSSLPVFQLQLLVVFAVTQICHLFLKHLEFPQFVSPVMAGLILGPTIHQETLDSYKKMLFPYGSQDTLATLSAIGYTLFIFTTGVQMDLSMVTRTGHRAWTFAIIGLAAPFFICLPILSVYLQNLTELFGTKALEIPVVVLSHTVISFAVVASTLQELKIVNSELGRLALSSVLVSDILGTTITGLSNVFVNYGSNKNEIIWMMMAMVAFVIIVPLVCRPVMFWIIKHTPEGRPVDDGYIYIIIVMVFALGWLSVQIGQDFILGAFVLGLSVPEGPPLGSALVKKLQFFGKSFLMPIFVTCSVMKADFSLIEVHLALSAGFFIGLTHLIKTIAHVITALFCKMPLKDAFTLSLILNSKGAVDVGFLGVLYDEGAISDQIYGVMIISVVIVGCIVKWFVKLLYDPSRKYAGYQKRNIMILKPESELRILACVHKQYNISAITDVLDLCSPTQEHPIIVDALHLIELVGRTSPIFISHRLQKTVSGSHKSYSDDIILAFDLYEHDNLGAATAHTYTAISPPSLMHEDVCQLALDRVVSIIILPFHQRWSIDGSIESDDKNMRSLNCRVLEIAPCSVGILVTRSFLQNNSSIRLAMIYLGGKDDREALCLAKRAINNPRINLVVYHLTPEEHIPSLEYLLDNEALEDIKKPNYGLGNLSYQRVTVNGGPETSATLRDIANEHDFFIVGRRHGTDTPQTEGLAKWSEFSELGAIGDLLASPDFESRAGILVVQQQGKVI